VENVFAAEKVMRRSELELASQLSVEQRVEQL
jgi:hypothetical protein